MRPGVVNYEALSEIYKLHSDMAVIQSKNASEAEVVAGLAGRIHRLISTLLVDSEQAFVKRMLSEPHIQWNAELNDKLLHLQSRTPEMMLIFTALVFYALKKNTLKVYQPGEQKTHGKVIRHFVYLSYGAGVYVPDVSHAFAFLEKNYPYIALAFLHIMDPVDYTQVRSASKKLADTSAFYAFLAETFKALRDNKPVVFDVNMIDERFRQQLRVYLSCLVLRQTFFAWAVISRMQSYFMQHPSCMDLLVQCVAIRQSQVHPVLHDTSQLRLVVMRITEVVSRFNTGSVATAMQQPQDSALVAAASNAMNQSGRGFITACVLAQLSADATQIGRASDLCKTFFLFILFQRKNAFCGFDFLGKTYLVATNLRDQIIAQIDKGCVIFDSNDQVPTICGQQPKDDEDKKMIGQAQRLFSYAFASDQQVDEISVQPPGLPHQEQQQRVFSSPSSPVGEVGDMEVTPAPAAAPEAEYLSL